MTLSLTHHAILRFVERWRPLASYQDARVELGELAALASMTKRQSAKRDAWLFVAVSPTRGERVFLVVRDGVVVTVLDEHAVEDGRLTLDPGMVAESAETIAFCRALLVADLAEDPPETPPRKRGSGPKSAEEQRRNSASDLIASWESGRIHPSNGALVRAHDILGLPLPRAISNGGG